MGDLFNILKKHVLENPGKTLNFLGSAANVMGAANANPEAALSGFLQSLAKSMNSQVSPQEAHTLATMVVRLIRNGQQPGQPR